MFINYGNFIEDYVFKHACIDTSIVFVMWPRRCYFTNKILFLKYVYRQTAMWTGPGDPVFEYRWYDKNEFIKAKLQELV